MEEFRSTEILDKEIQEDARKKSERLLRNAESDGKRVLDDVVLRVEKTAAEKTALYDKRIAEYKNGVDAALPLEKERFLVSFEDSSMLEAIHEYVLALTGDQMKQLLSKLLSRYKAVFTGKKITVAIYGILEKDASAIIRDVLGAETQVSFSVLSSVDSSASGAETGLLVETSDGSMRCRVTVSEIIGELLDIRRFELADALFCGRLTQ